MELNSLKIGVLMGGVSSERDISLQSGEAVYQALKSAGRDVCSVDLQTDREEQLKKQIKESRIDIAFIALHGRMGEDGTIQRILESMGILYTGSGVEASQLAMNKVLSHKLFKKNGLPVPEYTVIQGISDQAVQTFPVPLVVKPASEGSSLGITIVKEAKAVSAAVQVAAKFSQEIILERYIAGRELTVGILQEQALPVIEIRPKKEFYDREAKYQKGLTDYLVPAPIENKTAEQLQNLALEACRILGCRHFARVDFLLDKSGNPFILEVNTIPGFTALSLLPMAAKEVGIGFVELCQKMLSLAYAEKK